MKAAVYLPLLASVLVGLLGPRLAWWRTAPAIAAWALTAGTLVCTAATTWSLVLLSGTLLDDLPYEHAAAGGLDRPSGVNDLVAFAAAGVLVTGLIRLTLAVRERRAVHRDLRRLCAGNVAGNVAGLVVLADLAPQAFAVPGGGGHIVVSSGMLAALNGPERRVLLAHEKAHLASRHHWHTGVVRAAAAVNPLLTRLSPVSAYLCERWADETAARTVDDRSLAARALARAALATAATPLPPRTPCPPVAMGYHGTGVGARVAALQAPAPRSRYAAATVLLVLAALGAVADVHATGDFLRWMLPFLR